MDDIKQMECIVLAGGLGTRLRNTIGDFPKCMAEVNKKPFLHYIFQYLQAQQCTRVILSLGYMHEVVTAWLGRTTFPFEVDYVIEKEPLGTGGGIQLAMEKVQAENVMVLNGDTMFSVPLQEMFSVHLSKKAATTLALKEMHAFSRYGVVNTDATGRVLAFEEKEYREQGTINGGIYVINKQAFLSKSLPHRFSFEKDYLEKFVNEGSFFGYLCDAYFIDIGVPEDYTQAQEDFKRLFA